MVPEGLSSQVFFFPQVKSRGSDGGRQPTSGCLKGSRQSSQPFPCWSNPRTHASLQLICLRPQEIVRCFWLISYACIIRWQQLPSGLLARSNIPALGKELGGVRRGGLPQPCRPLSASQRADWKPEAWERSPAEGQRCSVKSDNRQVAEGIEPRWRVCQLMGWRWQGIAGWVGCHEHAGCGLMGSPCFRELAKSRSEGSRSSDGADEMPSAPPLAPGSATS